MALSRATLASFIHSVQNKLSPIEIVYTPHDKWPLPTVRDHSRPSTGLLRISVLDSSFNPPTLAHQALANSLLPSDVPPSNHDGPRNYDAKLLLLSVRNADKSLKSSDASYIQRLEMMLLLAKDLEANVPVKDRVAVAIIDEPTFVGKSSMLQTFFRQRLASVSESARQPQLTFLLGFDTLERLFSPRYYGTSQTDPDAVSRMLSALRRFLGPPPEGDDARVVCAFRGSSSSSGESSAKATLALAEEFLPSRRVVLFDIGEDERTYSSTAVRAAVAVDDVGWRRSVSPQVADYIVRERLYIPKTNE